ncbi:hypothetical protein PHYBLDRAFT_143819 [Phycomyces blakesleeanus NRRL 1555(-)]|uniref:Uncharacterized protein n=1 Tax=Phycomyces blakesleeanus (strain ATCC 8743b / DSM 1359 / FGSC 10004 / NBRC 33097 / NRRL 1555) TaxID=763407 RepID=A0A162XLK0_PHYB8|nr:hypothetical protein PHYBLDRAFT_143819 [Phycomyces blakesleeanus NRRL 1555(-)]OAD75575.1 hypothetical protein PHYBLDRAFT_143819 [Phycomyces blakesleeanus NRRL 1555(-)]|eukprot:XP_018293615.1 hypothetical protein PHYBLDRAFT_143819 [Phycomyces blakesleeanus NRRL 1555(-)]
MPEPSEAKTSEINHYLRPLVKELQLLYHDVMISTVQCPQDICVYAPLPLVAHDIPAACKTCEFTSHICNCIFTHLPNNRGMNYSGSLFSSWMKNARNKAKQKRMEKANGVRWLELYQLPYFNAVECTIINSIHNLFLGMTKRVIEKWRVVNLITKTDLATMQDEANILKVSIGSISLRKKIAKDFPFMKANK